MQFVFNPNASGLTLRLDGVLRGAPASEAISYHAPDGALTEAQVTPDGSPARNFAFDMTPACLVTGIITERGVAPANVAGLCALFPKLADR